MLAKLTCPKMEERSQQYMKRRGYLWPKHNTLTLGVSNRFALFTKTKYDSIESVISPVARHVVGVLNMLVEGDPILLLVRWDQQWTQSHLQLILRYPYYSGIDGSNARNRTTIHIRKLLR